MARTPDPPYVAVVLTTMRTAIEDGYEEMAQRMFELATRQPGFLGMEYARGADGLGITVSYWRTEEDVRVWRRDLDHAVAQRLGQERWYSAYRTRICRVEHEYGWEAADGLSAGLPRDPWP